MEVFRGKDRFIIEHRLKGFKETGGILDPWMGVLAYFKHEHTWKSIIKAVPGPSWIETPSSSRWRTRTIDIVFETFHGALLGEMHEIPPELMTTQSRKKWARAILRVYLTKSFWHVGRSNISDLKLHLYRTFFSLFFRLGGEGYFQE